MPSSDNKDIQAVDITTIDNSKYYVYINGIYIQHISMSAIFLSGNLTDPQAVQVVIPYLKEIEVLNDYHNLRAVIFHETPSNEIFMFTDGYVSSIIDYNYEEATATLRIMPSFFLLSQGDLGDIPNEIRLAFAGIMTKMEQVAGTIQDGSMGNLLFTPDPEAVAHKYAILDEKSAGIFKPGDILTEVMSAIMGESVTYDSLIEYFSTMDTGVVSNTRYLGSPVQIIANVLYLAVKFFSNNAGSFLDIIFIDNLLSRMSNLNILESKDGTYKDMILEFISAKHVEPDNVRREAAESLPVQPFNSWTSFGGFVDMNLLEAVKRGTTNIFSVSQYLRIWQNITRGKGTIQPFPSHYKRKGKDIINQISFYDPEFINRSKILLSNIFYPHEIELSGYTSVRGSVPTRYNLDIIPPELKGPQGDGFLSALSTSVSLILEETPGDTNITIKIIELQKSATEYVTSKYEDASGKVIPKRIPLPEKLRAFANMYQGDDGVVIDDVTKVISGIEGVTVDASVIDFINRQASTNSNYDDTEAIFAYKFGDDAPVVEGDESTLNEIEQEKKDMKEQYAEITQQGWQLYYTLVLIYAMDFAIRDYLQVTGRAPVLNEGVVSMHCGAKYPRLTHPVLCIYKILVSISEDDISEDNLSDYKAGYRPIKGAVGDITYAQYTDTAMGSSCNFKANTVDLWQYLTYFSMHTKFRYAVSKDNLGVDLYEFIYTDLDEHHGKAEFYRPEDRGDTRIFETFDLMEHLKAKPDRTVWISNAGLRLLNDHYTDVYVPINYITPEVYWKTFYAKDTSVPTGEGVGAFVVSMDPESETPLYSRYVFKGIEWDKARKPTRKFISGDSDPRELNDMLLQYQANLSYNRIVVTEDEVISRHTF